MVLPQNGRFKSENPIKMDDLGVTPISGNFQIRHSLCSVSQPGRHVNGKGILREHVYQRLEMR